MRTVQNHIQLEDTKVAYRTVRLLAFIKTCYYLTVELPTAELLAVLRMPSVYICFLRRIVNRRTAGRPRLFQRPTAKQIIGRVLRPSMPGGSKRKALEDFSVLIPLASLVACP